MRLETDSMRQLTYCTNIHAGDGWEEVLANLARVAPRVKARVAPHAPFGLGLRLSARECRELLEPGRLAAFHDFLVSEGMYVFTLNGFPYGTFHRQRVKDRVFAPDWTQRARCDYTLQLARVLASLLPAGFEGGISTVPLSFKPWFPSGGPDPAAMVSHLVTVAATLEAYAQEGKRMHLDLEPEPGGWLETTQEAVGFFEEVLWREGARELAARTGRSREQATEVLRERLRLCLDTCHMAVEYEEPEQAFEACVRSGVRIGKLQLGAALRIQAGPGLAGALAPFADDTYLHQVVAREGRGQRFYPDLPEALAAGAAGEWRIHFHVPLFAAGHGALDTTRDLTRRALSANERLGAADHLEIETYTWEVLPPELKRDLAESIALEYGWVLEQRAGARLQEERP